MTDILNLTGKDLDRELERIIKTSKKRRPFWTEKEDVILKRLYDARLTNSEIANAMGRSVSSVWDRISRNQYPAANRISPKLKKIIKESVLLK